MSSTWCILETSKSTCIKLILSMCWLVPYCWIEPEKKERQLQKTWAEVFSGLCKLYYKNAESATIDLVCFTWAMLRMSYSHYLASVVRREYSLVKKKKCPPYANSYNFDRDDSLLETLPKLCKGFDWKQNVVAMTT